MVNPGIGKEGTSFAFEPIGCSGTACASVRGIVFSVLNTDSIPDGSALYTCRVNISANAPFVTYPLNISRIVASDASGNEIAATGTNGSITVNRFAPTITATPTAIPVRAVIALGSAMAPPGNQQAEFGVFLNTMGTQVAAAEIDIIFDPSTPVAANADGSPQCTVNPNIQKSGTNFHFQPANCVPGVNCGAARAIVIAFDNVDPYSGWCNVVHVHRCDQANRPDSAICVDVFRRAGDGFIRPSFACGMYEWGGHRDDAVRR